MSSDERQPILFLNVGWMINYTGDDPKDRTRGSFKWLNQEGRIHGHECFNFADQNGYCFGSHPTDVGTNIDKLGAEKNAESVSGVLVVWFSKDPKTNKAVVVGWYKDATVFRSFQPSAERLGHTLYGDPIHYKTTAEYKNCKCLPPNERWFLIPSRYQQAGGYGQSPNWYGLGTLFLNEVWEYVQNGGKPQSDGEPNLAPHNDDHEKRRLIEDTAIRMAIRYYESPAGGGRLVRSVEADSKGWDLEAKGNWDKLLIEVKGLSGIVPVAELTPNEYAKMQERKSEWVLFIATECLSENPKQFEFRYMHDSCRWETTEGKMIDIRPKIAAIVGLI